MSFKISPTQTPNSTSFSVFTTKKILSHFHKQNITMLANKINKVVPLGVIHLGSNPHQLTNHIIPNRIMRYRCDYVKKQKWLHQAMLRFQVYQQVFTSQKKKKKKKVYFDVNFLLVLSLQFSKSKSCFRLTQIFQNQNY